MKTRMDRSTALFFCVFIFGLTLFLHIDRNNELTALKKMIPQLERETRELRLANERLRYEIERFESPIRLLELSKKPQYGHLKYPRTDEVLIISKKGAADDR